LAAEASMFTLSSFEQETALLQGVTDPVLKQGVCVAACDFWLHGIKTDNEAPAARRLSTLARKRGEILAYQAKYSNLRRQDGPERARPAMGASLGHNFDWQTEIMSPWLALADIRDILARDIQPIGAGATWTMRFAAGGHAIAGFHNIVAGPTDVIHQHRYHVFDPNIGEYEGDIGDLDAILSELFRQFPDYTRTITIRRARDESA
jgi:hypothetical protein